MKKAYKNCQKCGISLQKSSNNRSSSTNDIISKMYCNYCYEKGKSLRAYCTVAEMQAFVRDKRNKLDFPSFLAWFFVERTSKLKHHK
ncbi:MAG: hypothetical protein BGO68_03875 [Candidatus Amoebophilus sp. 36-38]|nr:MAG: hypothetical protein BGO68_03875 [Candidatus Amoebophilus sp. 36-38]